MLYLILSPRDSCSHKRLRVIPISYTIFSEPLHRYSNYDRLSM
nr:MAG TPA: hypothetical protein [Bacteriophage sp.]